MEIFQFGRQGCGELSVCVQAGLSSAGRGPLGTLLTGPVPLWTPEPACTLRWVSLWLVSHPRPARLHFPNGSCPPSRSPFTSSGPSSLGGASPPTSAAPVESRPPSQGGAEPPTLTMSLGAQDMSPHVTSLTAPGPWVQKPPHPQPLSAAQGQVSRRRGPLWPPVCTVPLGKSAHTLGPEAQGPRLALNLKLLLTPPHLVQPGRPASQAAGWRTRGAWPRSTDSGDPGQVTSHSRWVDVDPGPQKLPHPPTPGQVSETGMPPGLPGTAVRPPRGLPVSALRHCFTSGGRQQLALLAEGPRDQQGLICVCRGGKPTEPHVCF